MANATNSDLPTWDIPPNVNQQSLFNFLECVMEIAQSFKSMATIGQQGKEVKVFVAAPLMVSCSRRISIALRKILIDGNGSLLKRCVTEPDIHPLKAPNETPPMNFVRRFEEQRLTLGWADGTYKDIVVPAFTDTTTIHPLHGIRHLEGTKFALDNPFDHGAAPVKFRKWMNTKVIEIDGIQVKAEQLLRDMSNKEGAHIEENFSFIVPEDVRFDRDKNTLHRLANGVKFGSLTYMQIFSLYTGLYIVNRTRGMLEALPFSEGNQAVTYLCSEISQSPKTISTEDGEIEFTSYPLAVLGQDRNLRGDFASGTTSTFRVPAM